jgi:hypothetical protein
MHYMNDRIVNVGDWVVGISHNSEGKPVCGIVMELMPKQGPCNIRIHIWKDEFFTEEGHPRTIKAHESKGENDFGDSREFVTVADAFRMLKAVTRWGDYRAPYSV